MTAAGVCSAFTLKVLTDDRSTMIVYGDQKFDVCASALLDRLRQRFTAGSTAHPSLDQLRTQLILSGQVEQAVHDALEKNQAAYQACQIIEPLHALTEHAAEAFYARWTENNSTASRSVTSMASPLASLWESIARIKIGSDDPISVKVPEGFAFYALYPEQYIIAALRWAAAHRIDTRQRVVVIGIRSIGTTLAAVVTTALRAAGWLAHSFTVRPQGQPFARQVHIDPAQLAGATFGLVVDEGPGISGSSIAATAEALVAAGIPKTRISFLPGHNNEPGSAATETVRGWWRTAPRYVCTLNDVAFDSQQLPAALATTTADLFEIVNAPSDVTDLGGGSWRNAVYPRSEQWPATCVQFERPKYLCRLRDGRAVLWKFAGLAATSPALVPAFETESERLIARAATCPTPSVLGYAHGFVATRWIDGVPLSQGNLNAGLLALMGRYIAQASLHHLTQPEQSAAVTRLGDMLYWNTWELAGTRQAMRTRQWAEPVLAVLTQSTPPGYGDGHMAPHEWARAPSGQIMKADATGHEIDHTIVGRQSVVWDIAAVTV